MKIKAKILIKIAQIAAVSAVLVFAVSCRKTPKVENLGLLDTDETAEAGKVVAEANKDLTKIKVLYKDNEDKREEIKKAMEANDAEKVKKLSDDVVYLINDGTDLAKGAIEKISQAQEMKINADYRDYLDLKQKSLEKELEAFENYRQAARALRDNYDPKNKELREKIKIEFKNRSDNYHRIMETARDYSNQANTLAKASANKPKE